MTAQETFGANFFETTVTTQVGPTDLTANVAATSGLSVPCYVVLDPDVPTRREVWLVDSSITSTTLVATNISKRYLSGSAAGSGITHPIGAVVRCAPVFQHFTDVNDRVDATIPKSVVTAANRFIVSDGAGSVVEKTAAQVKTILAVASTDLSDFTEASQDVIGAMVTAAGGTYNDAAGTITLPGGSSSFSGCSVSRSAVQSIPSAATTRIVFNVEAFDALNMHASGVFTIPTTGKWRVDASVGWNGSASGQRILIVQTTATTQLLRASMAGVTYAHTDSITGVLSLTSGDLLEVVVYQDTGGALDVSASDSVTHAMFTYLGA